MLSTVVASVCIPNNSAKGFPFLHILASTCFLIAFCFTVENKIKMRRLNKTEYRRK